MSPTGGSGAAVNAAATVQRHFLHTSLRGNGEGAEKGLIQQFQGVQFDYTPVRAAEPRADSEGSGNSTSDRRAEAAPLTR